MAAPLPRWCCLPRPRALLQPYLASGEVAAEPFQETEAPPAAAGSAGSAASASADKRSEQAMVVRVHDAEKHGEGTLDAHVTYAITTQTSLPGYAAPRATVRRRYQDFVWLRTQLVREYPACIVPPMPEKHRLGTPSGAGPRGSQLRQRATHRCDAVERSALGVRRVHGPLQPRLHRAAAAGAAALPGPDLGAPDAAKVGPPAAVPRGQGLGTPPSERRSEALVERLTRAWVLGRGGTRAGRARAWRRPSS